MPKGYISKRQQNLKIGITSYTNNKTVLEVTGNVGIKTSDTQNYELYVSGDTNISGFISATSYYGSDGVNLSDTIANKIEGIEIQDNGSIVGTSATVINFSDGLSVDYYSGITTVSSTISILYNNINIGTGITSLNFMGSGISSITDTGNGISTITIELQSNLDGGTPSTNYGGIESIEGGSV